MANFGAICRDRHARARDAPPLQFHFAQTARKPCGFLRDQRVAAHKIVIELDKEGKTRLQGRNVFAQFVPVQGQLGLKAQSISCSQSDRLHAFHLQQSAPEGRGVVPGAIQFKAIFSGISRAANAAGNACDFLSIQEMEGFERSKRRACKLGKRFLRLRPLQGELPQTRGSVLQLDAWRAQRLNVSEILVVVGGVHH